MPSSEQYRRELQQARTKLRRERDAVGSAKRKVESKKGQLGRARTDTMRRQYERELGRLETGVLKAEDAVRITERKIDDLQTKIAREEGRQQKLEDERQRQRDAAQQRRERQVDRSLSATTSALEDLSGRVTDLERELLDRIRENVAEDPVVREHDIFLSHADPDTDVAQELYEELSARQLDVWFDGAKLRLGESLMRQLDRGIAKSRCGVLLITEAFLAGRFWGELEMTALVGGRRRVIPVLYGVTYNDLAEFSPILSTFAGLDADMHGLGEVSDQIARTLQDV